MQYEGMFNVDELSDELKQLVNISVDRRRRPVCWSIKRCKSKHMIVTDEGPTPMLQAMFHMMIMLGVNVLSRQGTKEFYRRAKIYEYLNGPVVHKDDKPVYITYDLLHFYKNIKIVGKKPISKPRFRRIVEFWVSKSVKESLEKKYETAI